jgi:hypothetical protein
MRLPIERIQFSASDVDADSGQGTIGLILFLAPGLTFTASFFVALSDEHLNRVIREAHQVFGRLGQDPNVVERFQSIVRLLRGLHFAVWTFAVSFDGGRCFLRSSHSGSIDWRAKPLLGRNLRRDYRAARLS